MKCYPAQNNHAPIPLDPPYELRTVVLQCLVWFTAVLVLLFGQHTILAAERFNRSFPEWFEEGEYVVSKAGGQSTTVRYRLFRPKPLDSEIKYPLLIWLHGEGEAGDDNSLQLRWLDLVFRVGTTRADYPYFVLATQCPSGQRAWAASGNGPPEGHSGHADSAADPLAVTYGVFKHLLATEPIDPDRVCVAGVSSGGTATWQLAIRYPEDFAALAPMSSRGADLQRVARLVHVPVWAFHAEDDRGSPVDHVKRTVAALQQAGGSAALTLIESYGHDSWTAAFADYDLMAWLLSQRRGVSSWTPPGHRPLKWWQIAVLIAVPAVIGIGWWSERRRRRKLARGNRRKPLHIPRLRVGLV